MVLYIYLVFSLLLILKSAIALLVNTTPKFFLYDNHINWS